MDTLEIYWKKIKIGDSAYYAYTSIKSKGFKLLVKGKKSDVFFVRTNKYNNQKCIRKIHFYDKNNKEINVLWAWAVKGKDLLAFLDQYNDYRWYVVNGRYKYAIDFKLLDEILTNPFVDLKKLIPKLKLIPFDPSKHTLKKIEDGYYDEVWDSFYPTYYFEPNYAIILSNKKIYSFKIK